MIASQHQFADPRVVNQMALAQMFHRPLSSALYLPEAQQPSYQAVAADVDGDGDEDKYAVRYSPITLKAGTLLALSGGEGDIDFEPEKWCQLLSFECIKEEVAGINVTNFTIGQDPQFPRKGGAMPLGLWSEEFNNKLVDAPWCGPNVVLTLSLQNTNAAAKTIWMGARFRVIVG